MELYNKLSKKERIQLIEKAGEKRLTMSFYKYHNIKNTKIFRNFLFVELNKLNVLGRIYIANEGINAQLSLPSKNIEQLKKLIDQISFLRKIRLNIAVEHDDQSFLKLKIKIRKKIVADGLKNKDYSFDKNGIHVNAKEFNELLVNQNTITIDMRNHYESEIGHFEGANLPDVDSFRESLPIINEKFKKFKKTKNILMYCTGGIRCEKASTFLYKNGYKNVYQLEGGIINYLSHKKKINKNSSWKGECFVFDNRVSINKNLLKGKYFQCYGCRSPITKKDLESTNYKKGVFCPLCYNVRTMKQIKRSTSRQQQIDKRTNK